MRKNLLAALLCLSAVFLVGITGHAQGTLIHYWNFNTYATTTSYPSFPAPINADYSRIDPAKTGVVLAKFPAASATYHSTVATVMDYAASVTSDYDTVNLRQSAVGGNYIRPRNPLDSVYLLFYIPTTNYQNILLTYGTQSSSFSSGDQYQYFDYSTDSGATWQTTGLSKLYDSALLVFKKVSVTIANPAVNNNPRLVFRIHFVGRNTGTSGNNRFDNISVDGDTIIAPAMVHYWHFNNTPTSTFNSYAATPAIDADFSLIDTAKTKIVLGKFPGTSATYHNATTPFLDIATAATTDYDTVNVRSGGTGTPNQFFRPRNPLDSIYMYLYIPSTGYHDMVLTYGTELSSTASGDKYQYFDYSTDSGVTWKNALLSEQFDSAATTFKRVTVSFTSDSTANNNPKLVFRIHFVGNANLTSGNNRFDNISVDGIPYPVYNSITTTAASYGPFCNASNNNISVAFSSAGTFAGSYSVQLSAPNGSFSSPTTIGTGTTSPITATIPSGTAAGNYRVRVVNAAPAIVSSNNNGTDIVVNAPPTAFGVTGSAAYCNGGTGVPVSLSGSQTGVRYKVFLNGSYINDSLNGTNAALNFGNVTAAGTYTISAFNIATPTCTTNMTGSAIVTVNPLPAAIIGAPATICANNIETLTDATSGGTWSSSFTSVATIDPNTGVLTALAAGAAAISYTLPTGCLVSANVAVNTAVPAIGGTLSVCTGLTADLSDASGGGTWASSNTSVATIDVFGGTMGGVSAGTTTISYTNTIGCVITTIATVNQTPSAITGANSVCVGSHITLGDAYTGGSWSISDATATIDAASGRVDGVSAGVPSVTYTLPAGCSTSSGIFVNPLPSALTGNAVVCAGSVTTLTETDGSGSWSSSNTALATVDASGTISGITAGNPTITFAFSTGCQTTAVVTVNPLPATITGSNNVCEGLNITLGESTTGGVFTSSATAIATIDPSTGSVTGITAGNVTISYMLPTTCMITKDITVNPLPVAITGDTVLCAGQPMTLANATTGGSWSSSSTIVSVVSGTGVITGTAAGTATITYSLPTGCTTTIAVTVNPLSNIAGVTAICSGLGGTLSDATTGGTWSSDNTTVLTIDEASGVFATTAAGVADITYTLPTGCAATSVFTVAQSPDAIAGDSTVCIGLTTPLSDAGLGTWSSSNTAIASVNATTGVVSGIAGGSATIVYSLGSGCTAHTTVVVNNNPPAITGTSVVCQGATITLGNAVTGGTWASASTATATIDVNGIITGIMPGTTSVSYTSPNGCSVHKTILVNQVPAAITGIAHFCAGTTSSLADLTPAGTWSSSNTALATINPVTGAIGGIASGTPVITYQLATGCYNTIVATINSLPAVYTVTGGGGYCAGSGGVHIGLSGSQSGVAYQLFYGVTHVGSPVAGTGGAIDFGAQVLANTYTVVANDGLTTCSAHMAGSTTVVINPLPAIHSVTGGGHYCSTAAGAHIGLDGSNVGINYTAYNGGIPAGLTVTGTASALDFGPETAGTYTIIAVNAVTSCSVNMASSVTVVEDPAVTPTISLSTGVGTTVCGGSPVTLTATTTNAGLAPVYFWTVNGITAPVSGSTYTYTPIDGDNVRVSLTSSAACATPSVVAGSLTLTVLAHGAPTAHIAVSPTTAVCQGTTVNFTSATLLGGTSPVMSWVVNGVIRGAGTTFSYAPSNGDNVSLILGSDYQCRSVDSGISNVLTMSVITPVTPTVVVTSDPATISNGESVTLSAGVTNGGAAPSYQWYVNGALVPGATYSSYSGTFFDNDSVYVKVTTNGVCSGYTGTGALKIHISHVGVAQVTATGSNIRMMPNPNNGSFIVKGSVPATGDEVITLMVTDMLGQVIYTANATAGNGVISEPVTLGSNLAKGMYLLNVRVGNQNNLFHFVIEK